MDIPHTLLTWPQLIFTCSFDWNEHWREGAFVTSLKSLRIQRKKWKGFHKMASRNVSNTITVAGRSVLLQKRGQFWRKCSLNDFTVLCFSEKRFWENFEAGTHIFIGKIDSGSVVLKLTGSAYVERRFCLL